MDMLQIGAFSLVGRLMMMMLRAIPFKKIRGVGRRTFRAPLTIPVANMSSVATKAPEAFSLVLASTPPGGSGTMRWIYPSPPGTFELVYGSSSQNK